MIALAIIGFPIALILAWALELTPDGIRVDVDEQKKAPALPAESVAKEKEDGFRSIAVLPFVNLSNDPDNEYFSDGMSEELLSLLCKRPQLTVASRTSSFSFRAKNIVEALELSLSPAQQRSIRKQASTRDMDAYDFYLRGRYYVERGDVDSGQRMFEKAIELDADE